MKFITTVLVTGALGFAGVKSGLLKSEKPTPANVAKKKKKSGNEQSVTQLPTYRIVEHPSGTPVLPDNSNMPNFYIQPIQPQSFER